jgi:hypothetical protein
MAILFGGTLLSSVPALRAQDEGSCSNASVAGKWGFTTNGTVVGVGPRDSLGIFSLDGAGELLQGRATSSLNGTVTDGPEEEDVTLHVLNAAGEVLATVSRSVPVIESGHALFVFPEGGVPVTPGEVYSIRLSGEYLFGWKYVVGGYENGEASFNGRPPLPDARSTFLFKTLGLGRTALDSNSSIHLF